MKQIERNELIPGHRYHCEWKDCCTNGYLIGTFLRWECDNPKEIEDGDLMFATAVFSTGEVTNPDKCFEVE